MYRTKRPRYLVWLSYLAMYTAHSNPFPPASFSSFKERRGVGVSLEYETRAHVLPKQEKLCLGKTMIDACV